MAKRPSELTDSLGKGSWWQDIVRYGVALAILIAVSVYIGFLLFGTNSVEVLIQLNAQEKSLKRSIEYLKMENARLQKEYFELKQLEPEQ